MKGRGILLHPGMKTVIHYGVQGDMGLNFSSKFEVSICIEGVQAPFYEVSRGSDCVPITCKLVTGEQ